MGVPQLWTVLNLVLGSCKADTIQCDSIIIDCNIIFHQCLYKQETMQTYSKHVEHVFISKLTYLFKKIGHRVPVFFAFDGVAGKVKLQVQKNRRLHSPAKQHLSPCTSHMYFMELVIQQVCTTLGLKEAYVSSSFVPGEGEYKLLQWISSRPDLHHVIIVSRDNDLIFLALLRLSSLTNVYIYNDTYPLIHVNKLITQLHQKHINIPLFVLSFFVFGNDFSPQICSLTEKNVLNLLEFLENKPFSISGITFTPTTGSHTWTIGHSFRVHCESNLLFKQFMTDVLTHVPKKRTITGPIGFKPFLWNLKYYCGDPHTNLNRIDQHISDYTKNRRALNPWHFHRRQQTLHLFVAHVQPSCYVKRLY